MVITNEGQLEAVVNTKKESDSLKYNYGICVFSVLNVLLVTIIVVSASYIVSEKRVIALNDADICVPCADLKLHPDDIIEGIERRGGNKTVCCMVEEDLDALFGNYVDHWLKNKLATEDRRFDRYKCDDGNSLEPQKPNIKLVGKHEKQSVEHHKLHWDGDAKMAIVPEDDSITHHKEHGFIEIKKSGLYQVYSQIVLDTDRNSHNHSGPDTYYHSVILIAAETSHHISPREITLLKATNSHCVSKTNRQTITSYLGAAFELSAGDKLAVKVNNITEVVPVPHMNFFGAYLVKMQDL